MDHTRLFSGWFGASRVRNGFLTQGTKLFSKSSYSFVYQKLKKGLEWKRWKRTLNKILEKFKKTKWEFQKKK